MGCTLTNGYSLSNCVASVGGVYTIYIAGHEKNIAFSNSTGGLVNGYDAAALDISSELVGGLLTFKEFEQDIEIAGATESVTVDRATGTRFYEQSVNLTIHYGKDMVANDATRTTMEELSKGNMLLIVKENSGIHKMYGAENGLRVTTGAGGTGTGFGDLNGITLTLTGKESEASQIIDLGTAPAGNNVAFSL